MSIPTTPAVKSNCNTSPTFSTLLRQTSSFFGDASVMSSLLLESNGGNISGKNPTALSLTGLGIKAPLSLPVHDPASPKIKQEEYLDASMNFSELSFTDQLELQYPPSSSSDQLELGSPIVSDSSYHDFWSTSTCSHQPDTTFGSSIYTHSADGISSVFGSLPEIDMVAQPCDPFAQDAGINPLDIMMPTACSPLDFQSSRADGCAEAAMPLYLPRNCSPHIKMETKECSRMELAPEKVSAYKSPAQYSHGRVINRKRLLTDSPEEARAIRAIFRPLSPVSCGQRDPSYQPSSPIPEQAPPFSRASTLPPQPQADDQDVFAHVVHTPILNAHMGIDLVDLLARASKYRMRCPGQEIDNIWLMAFAGKLTQDGALCTEFRCYVNGCGQTNKRRDHIVVHVGSHVDQRPFKCDQCGMRFLRKNECKRHVASHSDLRPWVCHICPPNQTKGAFIRQDLLKRHLRRSHEVEVIPVRPLFKKSRTM
ncbi:hypothetical protein FIBSPDRAFT_961675 [Athelia psychrophila]|uniref:C2H2-type domain-containing protein n=1 Tax=Athelia psychrophila TaxID=1759441 RepID=A0A166AZA1_9AGAM|nr:hypothetical protein FIBSPDRAFT_961675 [Fibularhizoctonia sp. CBS 109695]